MAVNDPIALVVGVGGGTGAALCRRFAHGGYRVAMIARDAERLADLEREIDGTHAYPCDVADFSALDTVVGRVRTDMGDPRILIHNAVAATFGTFSEVSVEDLERNHRINAGALLRLAQLLVPAMIDAGEGAIMVTGNTSSFRGVPNRPAFAPTKAAQRVLAQCLAKDLGPKRIHVGYIAIDAAIDAPWIKTTPGADQPATPAGAGHHAQDYYAHPDAIANEVFHIAHQHPSTWSFDHVIRPFTERWTLN